MNWLALLISIPAIGAGIVAWLARKSQARAWFVAMGVSALHFIVTLTVMGLFNSSRSGQ